MFGFWSFRVLGVQGFRGLGVQGLRVFGSGGFLGLGARNAQGRPIPTIPCRKSPPAKVHHPKQGAKENISPINPKSNEAKKMTLIY